MFGFSDAKGLIEGVLKLVEAMRDRLDPARRQAQRLITAFEAHGIARQQLPRILPRRLKLPPADLSTPDKLKTHLTPELLDWAAEYLALQRNWFDGVEAAPHLTEDHYKVPGRYREWMKERQRVEPDVGRYLLVWKPAGERVGPEATGPLVIIYEEVARGLGGGDMSRYWLLTHGWCWDHLPCLENMVAVVSVAGALGVHALGHDVPKKLLKQVDAGMKLVPEALRHRRGAWHPEDLVNPLPGRDSEWRRSLWAGAGRWLERGDILPASRSRTSR